MADKDEFITTMRKRFTRAVDGESKSRDLANVDRDMRNGEQWPEWAVKQRADEQRPMLTFNYLASLLRQVTGDVRTNKMQMKARAGNSNSMEDADIDNALFKHIQYISNADLAFDWAVEQAAACGFPGYFRAVHDYSKNNPFEQDIFIQRIKDSFCVYGDPNFNELDASDRNFYFITKKRLKEDFEKDYPNKTTADLFESSGNTEAWFTGDSVTEAEYWYREPVDIEYGITAEGEVFETESSDLVAVKTRKVKSYKVYQCIVSGSEVLVETKEYPTTIIPIFPVFGEELITDEGVVHKSVIRDAIPAQQLYNFAKTNLAETAALQNKNPYIATDKQIEGHPEWYDSNKKTYPVLTYNPDSEAPAPSRQGFAGVDMGQVQLSDAALRDMEELASVHKASRGAASNETSGKAINARKEGDDIATFYIVDNLKRAIELCARVIVEMRPTIYDTPRILRIVGEDGNETSMPINQKAIPEKQKTGKMIYKPADENDFDAIHIDATKKSTSEIYVEAGPSFSSQRVEAAEKLGQLMQAAGSDGLVIWPQVIKNQDFEGADEAAEAAKAYLIKKGVLDPEPDENGNPPANPQQDAVTQAQSQQLQAEQQKIQAENSFKAEELRLKDKELDIKALEIQLKHEEAMSLQPDEEMLRQMIMQTVSGMMQPEQPPIPEQPMPQELAQPGFDMGGQ